MVPPFDYEELAEDERTVTFRDEKDMIRQALKEGAIGRSRMSMDHFVSFPVRNMADWQQIKRRYDPTSAQRYEPNWRELRVAGWRERRASSSPGV